ncbi:MAG: hypothetical protein LBG65_06105 [Puniceicoccales bacterium]|jgi:hypothetical protein|nr:hypothetical protein [Puniceicoccales bacterium]
MTRQSRKWTIEMAGADERAGAGWAKGRVELRMKQVRGRLGGRCVEPGGGVIADVAGAI